MSDAAIDAVEAKTDAVEARLATEDEWQRLTAAIEAAETTAAAAEEKKPESVPEQQGEETLTLENMAQASHEELLAFCGRHPEVGIDPSKCAAPFFRSMIEHRIRAYLSPAT